jgi:hypothetical protein
MPAITWYYLQDCGERWELKGNFFHMSLPPFCTHACKVAESSLRGVRLLQRWGHPDTAFKAPGTLSENAHLRRSPHPSSLRRTVMYASFLSMSHALHLCIFHQPPPLFKPSGAKYGSPTSSRWVRRLHRVIGKLGMCASCLVCSSNRVLPSRFLYETGLLLWTY